MAKPGRLAREEQTLPPNIQKALAARASGSNWNEAAEVGKITPVNLRKWRKHPDAAGYLQECIQHNIEDATSYIADNAPALAVRLVELGLDRTTRPYAAIQAIAESFKIMSNNIADRENREELRTIKAALDRLEGVSTVDIYAESEE